MTEFNFIITTRTKSFNKTYPTFTWPIRAISEKEAIEKWLTLEPNTEVLGIRYATIFG